MAALASYRHVVVEVLTFSRPPADAAVEATGDGGTDGATPRVHRLLSARPRSLRSTVEVMRRARPDVIHYQFAIPAFGLAGFGAIAAGMWTRRNIGTRLVFTFHEARREVELLRWPGRFMYQALVAIADAVVVHTEEVRDLVIATCGADEDSGVADASRRGAATGGVDRSSCPGFCTLSIRGGGRPLVLCFGYLHPTRASKICRGGRSGTRPLGQS